MSGLQRHVPRLALEWAATHPDERWRRIEGTLCFADISGFTALAERLAQRGRQGGEELVQTLGTVFSEMLEIAGARGGSLLKFGGDALLLFFQGDDHAVQGACAAVEMRQALRAASNRRTSVGRLRLSM
ncbi:MAG: adenylate/guanylate cyclase domain-containing protein, partial [Gammaproteobacteria bacterium]